MGPGMGRNIASLIIHGKPVIDQDAFDTLSFYRDFYRTKKEALK